MCTLVDQSSHINILLGTATESVFNTVWLQTKDGVIVCAHVWDSGCVTEQWVKREKKARKRIKGKQRWAASVCFAAGMFTHIWTRGDFVSTAKTSIAIFRLCRFMGSLVQNQSKHSCICCWLSPLSNVLRNYRIYKPMLNWCERLVLQELNKQTFQQAVVFICKFVLLC